MFRSEGQSDARLPVFRSKANMGHIYQPTEGILNPNVINSYKLKLSGAIAHEGQDQQCPSQYTGSLGAEVHEQTSRSGGQSEAKPPVF
ncbi:hypothetical protein TNCV_2097401 [Trichonephila clavipes]|nr:hypothetical protein TNCV_2097401 [Trichonephila clavipes]